jgi:hypothetical protein
LNKNRRNREHKRKINAERKKKFKKEKERLQVGAQGVNITVPVSREGGQ